MPNPQTMNIEKAICCEYGQIAIPIRQLVQRVLAKLDSAIQNELNKAQAVVPLEPQ